MPTTEPIQIGMYRRGARSVLRSHWINRGAIACGKAEAGLQAVRQFSASEVALMTALCTDCRGQLLTRKLIAEPKKA